MNNISLFFFYEYALLIGLQRINPVLRIIRSNLNPDLNPDKGT